MLFEKISYFRRKVVNMTDFPIDSRLRSFGYAFADVNLGGNFSRTN
jgi:hypothetical protein